MEMVSKVILCALALVTTLKVISDLRIWTNPTTARHIERPRDGGS